MEQTAEGRRWAVAWVRDCLDWSGHWCGETVLATGYEAREHAEELLAELRERDDYDGYDLVPDRDDPQDYPEREKNGLAPIRVLPGAYEAVPERPYDDFEEGF